MKELLVKLAGKAVLGVGQEDEILLLKCINYMLIQSNLIKSSIDDDDIIRAIEEFTSISMKILGEHSSA